MAQGMSESKKQKDLARRAENFSPEAIARKVLEEQQKKVRDRPDSTVQADPEFITKTLLHSIQLASIPPTDMDDPEAVANTIFQYFELCAQEGIKANVTNLALALSIDNRKFSEYVNGTLGKGKNASQVRELLKKAKTMLEGQMNLYMENGKINPVAGIFLMKNHFGYQNETEVTIKPTNPLGEGQTEEELKQKYIDSVQIVAFEDENGAN